MLTPYYEHAGITIYHGDCREVLPELRPDAIVTDPPYGIDVDNHGDVLHRDKRNGRSYAIQGDSCQTVGLQVIEFAHTKEIPLVTFASPWKPWPGEWRNLLVWDKGPAVGGGGHTGLSLKRTWELIQVARNPAINGSRDSSVLRFWVTPQNSAGHIAAKPLALMKYILAKFTLEWNLVVDPFAGTGVTLVAAKNLGRAAIGIEIEERYCEIAAKRLAQEVFEFDAPCLPEVKLHPVIGLEEK